MIGFIARLLAKPVLADLHKGRERHRAAYETAKKRGDTRAMHHHQNKLRRATLAVLKEETKNGW